MSQKIIFTSLMLFLAATSLQPQKQSQETQIQQVLHLVFEAFAEGDLSKLEHAVTPDVKVLENGEVWTLDTLRAYFSRPRPADFKRINTLDFFQTAVEGTMAFVSYHNAAAIHANGKDRNVKWLESAVLVRRGKLWKVKMLHSTRLEVK